MAEGFEPYHVPQQSRRDKLRVLGPTHNPTCVDHLPVCAGLLPVYDPSLIHSDLLTCADDFHNQPKAMNPDCVNVKDEGPNLMAFASTSQHSRPYMDPHLNPSSIEEENCMSPYLYTAQNTREPLSLSLSSSHNGHHNLEIFNERSCVPLGPFTGYASILKTSRFLKPAQQLLEATCDVGNIGIYAEKMEVDSSLMNNGNDNPMEGLSGSSIIDANTLSYGENVGKKSRLISMLDEVYRRYKQYYQQLQAVVASFESVAGLGNAAPYATFALKAMSKHFKCLKNAITDQIQFTSKARGFGKDEASKFPSSDNRGPYSQRPVQNSAFLEHQPVWRPQRGLPERAVTVLRAWLFEHFLHPYPTDTDKVMLAKQTGLSRSQVSNWFINARVRLWKPMVEEIHTLETRQTQKASSQRSEQLTNRQNEHLPSANSFSSEANASTQRPQDLPHKRTRNEFPDMPLMTSEEPMNLSYNNFSHDPHMGVGVSSGGGSAGVSLTLGLYQNNTIGLQEPFPINAARRFGIDVNGDGYVMGGFEGQSRHFGGQLLHDFVG